jgi:hypothetical protein
MSILENKVFPPDNPVPTASSFANWVFEITNPYYRKADNSEYAKYKSEQMKVGKLSHRRIDLFFQQRWAKKNLKCADRSEWDLIYRDTGSPEDRVYKCSYLKIGDKPMRCKPDAVLRHKNTKSILIIEHKTTTVSKNFIPHAGWPNIQAQLWCYSWIDEWLSVSDVQLVGWLWHRKDGALISNSEHSFSWNRSDKEHNEYCNDLFKVYGGEFTNPLDQ